MTSNPQTFNLLLVKNEDSTAKLVDLTHSEAARQELKGLNISTALPHEVLERFKKSELDRTASISAILFTDTAEHYMTDFIDYTENRHYPLPVFYLGHAEGADQTLESPLNKRLEQHGVRSFLRAEIESGAFVAEIYHCILWTDYILRRWKREQFSSIAKGARYYSHEIRNPLTNIDISVSELRVEGHNSASNQRSFIHFIEKNSRRINELLGTVLQNTRTEDLYIETVSLDELIDSVITACSYRFPAITIRFKEHLGAIVRGDEEKLGAAFYHLIVNAAEACHAQKGLIDVRIALKGESINISISDNGMGISLEDSAFIFEPFYTTKTKSAGLGLSAADDIINRHQGSISFRTNPRGGMSFFISLPVDSDLSR